MGKAYCCVVNCHNTTGKVINGRPVSLHRFPTDLKIRKIWISRVSRRNWQPTVYTRICCAHFVGQLGPTKESPLPTIFPHRTYALSQLSDASVDEDVNRNKENINLNIPEVEYAEPVNFLAGNMLPIDTSVHLHDYCCQFDSSHLSRHRFAECQTKPEPSGTEAQTELTGVPSTTNTQTQTPRVETADYGVQVNLPSFTVEDLESDEDFAFYTGLPTRGVFTALFEGIQEAKMKQEESKVKCGRPKKLRMIDEFFMVLIRLRLGLLINDLSQRFCVGRSTCQRILTEWIDFLYVCLSPTLIWPPREAIRSNMPAAFKRRYPNCRVIIDCTEIFTETPQSLANRSLMYSDYKSHMTWKLLLGISPSGVITFVSDLWAGSISDKMITKKSGFVEKLESGDAVMADKGFLIADILTPKGIHLIIPPKRNSRAQMTISQVEQTRRVANLRIHIERAVERIKNFRIIQGVIPISVSQQISKMVKIICVLSNMQPPLISDNE